MDKFLEKKEKRKETKDQPKEIKPKKIYTTKEEWKVLLLKYYKKNGELPHSRATFKDDTGKEWKVGSWFSDQKKKIINTESGMYVFLSDESPCIQEILDKYLQNKEERE